MTLLTFCRTHNSFCGERRWSAEGKVRKSQGTSFKQYTFWKQGQLARISTLFSYKTHLGLLFPLEVTIHLATQHSFGWPKKDESAPGQAKTFLYFPKQPDCLWDPSSLLFSGYLGPFPQQYSSWDMKWATQIRTVPIFRMSEATPLLSSYAFMTCTRTTLFYTNLSVHETMGNTSTSFWWC
jgi:hypothetical protein